MNAEGFGEETHLAACLLCEVALNIGMLGTITTSSSEPPESSSLKIYTLFALKLSVPLSFSTMSTFSHFCLQEKKRNENFFICEKNCDLLSLSSMGYTGQTFLIEETIIPVLFAFYLFWISITLHGFIIIPSMALSIVCQIKTYIGVENNFFINSCAPWTWAFCWYNWAFLPRVVFFLLSLILS